MTIFAQLVAKDEDNLGYITYVFKCLEEDISSRYIMCVRYPNWQHRNIQLNEIGYLNFVEVVAGIDKWYDGNNMIPYKYDATQFIKFVPKEENKDYKYIM